MRGRANAVRHRAVFVAAALGLLICALAAFIFSVQIAFGVDRTRRGSRHRVDVSTFHGTVETSHTETLTLLHRLQMLRASYEQQNMSYAEARLHRTLHRNISVGTTSRTTTTTSANKAPHPTQSPMPAAIRHLTCDPVALPFIPPFTRRSEHVRPRFAVITMNVRVADKVEVTSPPRSPFERELRSRQASSTKNNSRILSQAVLNRMQFVNKMEYCQRHGYDFIVEGQDALDRRRAPQWSKLRVIRKWLPFYDWIMWADEDVLFTNWSHTIEHLVHTRLDEYMLRNLNEQERLAAHNGDPFEYKAPEVDVILTEDWNSWNTGVVFWRNSPWANDFLRRMFRVSAAQAAPFHDQGALIFLAFGHRFGRDNQAAAADRAHMWVMEDNYFNSYPFGMILEKQHMPWMWEKGDWAIHFASCKFFPECIAEATYAFREAACENGGYDLPVHLFVNDSTRVDVDAAQKSEHRDQILRFAKEYGENASHWIDPAVVDWNPPDSFRPPHSLRATFPPMFERAGGVRDSDVFAFPPLGKSDHHPADREIRNKYRGALKRIFGGERRY